MPRSANCWHAISSSLRVRQNTISAFSCAEVSLRFSQKPSLPSSCAVGIWLAFISCANTDLLQLRTPVELLNTLEPSSSKRESSVKASSERAIDKIISARRGSEIKLFSLTTGISSAKHKRLFSSSHTAKRIAKSLSTELGENLSSR